MSVVLDTAELTGAQLEAVAREDLAVTAARVHVRFECAPKVVSHRVESWQLGQAGNGRIMIAAVAHSSGSVARLMTVPALASDSGSESTTDIPGGLCQ